MKRIAFFLMIGAAMITACSDSANDDNLTPELDLDVDLEATIESSYEDIDVLSDAAIDGLETNARDESRGHILECASVERDTINQTITIDYGDGCFGYGGRTRSGKILITYSGRRFEPGSYRIITFDNFSIDSILIEGTRTLTNISDSISDSPIFRVTMVGGKLTFLDGTTATREADHTRTWYRAANPLEDHSTIDGSASGINQEGDAYTIEITETLVFKRVCQPGRVFVPVQGETVITVGEEEVIVDYGDGECDNLITWTKDGETEVKEIEVRRRRRARG